MIVSNCFTGGWAAAARRPDFSHEDEVVVVVVVVVVTAGEGGGVGVLSVATSSVKRGLKRWPFRVCSQKK